MNFFEHQDRARSKTTLLAFLFALAVAGIIVGLYLASRVIFLYSTVKSGEVQHVRWWDLQDFASIAVLGIAFIGIASAIKMQGLRGGGSKVATMLGGRLVRPDTRDLKERRLLNVVEEMAIASGVPVPMVYVLDEEQGINAFAAGHSTSDAAIAVTRGCLITLSRDELQGVIGHEFSHILNGDMRLNIRLIGILFGVLAMTIVGRILVRAGYFSGRGASRRGGGTAAIALMGIALILVGYIGILVGRMIQSAVSRQREFLADASAVQFTRNPQGIASALKKIGGYGHRSYIQTPQAEQASHLFFGQGRRLHLFTRIFSTHPPLEERIRRIDPSFAGEVPPAEAPAPEAARALGPEPLRAVQGTPSLMADPSDIARQVGNPTAEHLLVGSALRQMVPDALGVAISIPEGAAHTVYALLLEPDPEARGRELDALAQRLKPSEMDEVRALYSHVESLDPRARLPVVDLAMPSLRRLPDAERDRFLTRVEALVRADEKLTLFEFAVQWMVVYRLGHAERPPGGPKYRRVGPLLKDIALLLSAMAHAGNPGNPEAARRAFDLGRARIADPDRVSLPFAKREDVQFKAVGRAFDRFSLATYEVRGKIIDACAHTALADRAVTVEEAELLRVVSLALDCPLPPFLVE